MLKDEIGRKKFKKNPILNDVIQKKIIKNQKEKKKHPKTNLQINPS